MVTVVANLTKGEYFTSNHYKAPEHRVVQGALRLLARFMELMARYLRAQNLNKGGNLDDQENFDELGTGFDSLGHIKDEMTDDLEPQNWTNIESNAVHGRMLANGTNTESKKDDAMSVDSLGEIQNELNDNTSDYSNPKFGRERSLGKQSVQKPPTINEENVDSGNETENDSNANSGHKSRNNNNNKLSHIDTSNAALNSSKTPSANSENGTNSTLSANVAYTNGNSPKNNSSEDNSNNTPNMKGNNNSNNNSNNNNPSSPNPNGDDSEAQPAISLSAADNRRKHVWETHKSSEEPDWNNINPRSQRANTWYLRYATHKEDQKVIDVIPIWLF